MDSQENLIKVNGRRTTQLSELVYLLEPADGSQAGQKKANTLIVLCSWMDAARKHVGKYTAGWNSQLPNATILVVESNAFDILFRSQKAYLQRIEAARIYIAKEASSGGKIPTKVILHAFSNGGAYTASQLATALQKDLGHSPFSSIVLDCCPGRPHVMASARAVAVSIPVAKSLASVVFALTLMVVSIYIFLLKVLRIEDAVTASRRRLNDRRVFPPDTPRLYICSKGDAMIEHTDVHQHALHACRAGYFDVREAVFEKAAHCSLMRDDPEQYWSAIMGTVEVGGSNSNNKADLRTKRRR